LQTNVHCAVLGSAGGKEMNDLSALSPNEWLEHHRTRAGYGTLRYGEDPEHLRVIKERFPTSFERLIQKFGSLTNADWQDLLIQRILMAIRLTEEEKAKIGDIFFGVFPTRQVRGRKDKTERGDTVVLLHDGLIMTVWSWSLLYALRFQGNDFDRLMSDTKAAANFFAAVGRFWNPELQLVKIENPIPFELTEHSWGIVTALIDSCLAYILGHEIGHLLEKHAGYTDDQMENYRMEYKADQWGLRFVSDISCPYMLLPRIIWRDPCCSVLTLEPVPEICTGR
jgi:hypothetical protein